MVRHLSRNEARSSDDYRRTTDAGFLAPMEPIDDRTAAKTREESSMSAADLPSRQEVEDLFYQEAALLDEWRLEEWLEMLTDDAIYQVPSSHIPAGDARNTLS